MKFDDLARGTVFGGLQNGLAQTQAELNELLSKFSASYNFSDATLSKAMGQGVGRKTEAIMRKTFEEFCKEHSIDPAAALHSGRGEGLVKRRKKEDLPPMLAGAWLFVQYRGKRITAGQMVAPRDFRTAVLKYGRLEKAGKRVDMFGESTRWVGHVNQIDSKLHYFLSEDERDFPEVAYLIMLRPFEKDLSHGGIILGVARGEQDRESFPIYSSVAMLKPIPQDLIADDDKKSSASEVEFLRAHFVGYFKGKSASKKPKKVQSFLASAFVEFEELAKRKNNYGDRIFVRF